MHPNPPSSGAARRTTASPRRRVAAAASSAQARQRVLAAALQLFSTLGYNRTGVRAIATAAGVNVSAIGYYFGDKAGLYRATLSEPLVESCEAPAQGCTLPELPLDQALAAFMSDFLAPLKLGETARRVVRLHFRELVEPTAAGAAVVAGALRPEYEALLARLALEFGQRRPDATLQRLAFAVLGLAVHYYVAQDRVEALAPDLLADAAAVDALAQDLARFACAMIAAERRRRTARPARGGR
jgi:AcrR family transcriptional regulator